MAGKRWLPFALGAALLGGCAHDTSVFEERVAHLPPAERSQILNVQRNVDVAADNVAAARVARDEARQFFDVAGNELTAARAHLDASRAGVELTRRSHQPAATIERAEDARRRAQAELDAARIKRDYAERLVVLRDAELAERQARADVARADLDWVKFNALNRRDLSAGLDDRSFSEARRQSREQLARRGRRVATLEGEVEHLRLQWEQRRRDVAARGESSPLEAPLAPQPLAPPVPDANSSPNPQFSPR